MMSVKFFSKKTAVIAGLAGGALLACAGLVWYFFFSGFQLSGSETLASRPERIEEPANSYTAGDKLVISPACVSFSQPAARLDKLYVKLESGITMHPAVRGSWSWNSDRVLCFMPEEDWIPGTTYEVKLGNEIFNPQIKVRDREFSFSSPAFEGKVTSEAFYENPKNIKDKAATASFSFNYPLNVQNLKDKISVKAVSGEKYDFTYKVSDFDKILHVVSSPVKISSAEDFVKISVAGVENAYNKKPLKKELTATVKIPSSSSFFKVKSVKSSIVRNEQDDDNPEQILSVDFTTAVKPFDLKKHFALYYSEEGCYQIKNKLAEKGYKETAAKGLKKLETVEVSVGEENLKKHMLKYDLREADGCLLMRIDKTLNSAEGFNLGKDVVEPVSISPYPQEVKIAFDGSILSLRGSREVAFLSRGVSELRASVARIDASDLNHLTTQTSGDFSHPYFINYNFNEDNISEIFEKSLKINMEHPGKPNYSALDLNEYFRDKKGVFLVKVRGYDGENRYSREDSRLVMITDLGIVVKDNLDKTHNVFVSNISEGRPVSDAVVEVLGKNGLPVLTVKTNREGEAVVPDFSGFKKDRTAVVYKVTDGSDVSFLPINRNDRRLNMSRFDVGGEYVYEEEDVYALKGYVFSDRGIYRPGEEAHFGFIVRQKDLNVPKKMPFVAEIRNSRGDVVSSQNLWADSVGFMAYSFTPDRAAPTGRYNISLYVLDNRDIRRYVAGSDFKVEEFQPDNLRIKADWEGYDGEGWSTEPMMKAEVSLYNLYGNPASGHELKASYKITPADFVFKKYKGYLFRDPLRNDDKALRSYSDALPEQKTDNAGAGAFVLKLSEFEQGTYNLRLSIDGLEQGSGRGVSISLGALVSPNKYLIGWKADGNLAYIDKNAVRHIQFIAVDNKLQQIAKDGLYLTLARRRYISSLVEMPNGTYRYQMVPKEQVISKRAWTVSDNGASELLKTDEPGEYILTVEGEDGRLLAKAEYSVAGAANLSHAIDRDASLGLKLNRNEYNQGEKIEMQITAPYEGYGLITIERDSVYAFKWFKAGTNSVVEEIELPNTVEGNAYVNVAFFRDEMSKEIYMPALSYAVAPFSINKQKRRLDVRLEVPETVKPGDELKVGYKTSAASKIIVYGVNEGILQVAGYKTPDPLNEFLKKKALRVVTSQIMDLIMPDIKILRMLTASGGDGSYAEAALDKNLNPFARRTDKPVAFWSGIADSSEAGGTYTYQVPETFNGEIKVMAVAVSESRFGHAAASVLSRGDFALIPSGPLNVSPGDEFVVGLSVGNLVDNSGDDYEVRVALNAGSGFEVIGERVQSVKLPEKGEAMVKFRLKALPKLGAQELMFTAESVRDSSRKARMPYTMSLRPSTPYGSKFAMGYETSQYRLQGVEDLYPEFRVQQLSASGSPLVLASGLLKYLDKFPHGCTEQLVSKVFPAMEVLFKSPALAANMDVYALFDDVMVKLRERQTLDGGFTTWSVPGAKPDAYDSVYAAHFLVKAREHDFNVPENMLKKALSYCEEQAGRSPEGPEDMVPAYAAYVLTLGGKVTTNYLLNLEEYYKANYEKSWRKSLGASFMAASYKLLQDENKARGLAGQYQPSGNLAADAANVYLMATYFPDMSENLGKKTVEVLLKPLSSGDFTTDSAAFATLALNALSSEESDKDISFSGMKPVYTPFPTVDFVPRTKNLTVSSKRPFYYVAAQQGFAVGDKKTAAAEGLEVSKAFYDRDGKQVSTAKLGDELTVKVIYRGLRKEPFGDVAIVDMLPGCFEAVSNSLQTDWNVAASEIREDRVVAYVTADREAHEFTYKVRIIAEGDFIVPPVYGSALYLPLVRANSASGMIKVSE